VNKREQHPNVDMKHSGMLLFALLPEQKSQHERNVYDMFSKSKASKNVREIGSHGGSLQGRGHQDSFPPPKKPRLADSYTTRQARVDDAVWGEDLDANTVEECFILATQALSQVRTPGEVNQAVDP
jgi:hypothetical protein